MSLNIEESIRLLSNNAPESDVEKDFSRALLEELGFGPRETKAQYKIGRKKVDWAARKNHNEKDIFAHTPENPELYLEAKSKNQCLDNSNHSQYVTHLSQLRSYLQDPKSASVQWGILTNSIHAQLFLKHGKVVYPATPWANSRLKCITRSKPPWDSVRP